MVFNLILAVSWCLLRGRRKLKKGHKRRISGPVDCERYEKSVAFAVTTGAIPAPPPSSQEGKSYYALLQALQGQPKPPAASQGRLSRESSNSSADHSGLKKLILRPQDLKELDGVPRYPKRKGHLHAARRSTTLQVPGPPGLLTRSNSVAETASVYSSASAPIDYHDHLFRTQPFALDSKVPASAPAWISEMPTPPTPAVVSRTSSAVFDSAYPSPSASIISDASTIRPPGSKRLSAPPPSSATSPIAVPTSSVPTVSRERTASNPSNIRWKTPVAVPSPPSSAHSRRPNSVSSLSTIFSVREVTRLDVAPATIEPLNIQRPARRAQWGSVDMTRSTPLPLTPSSQQAFTAGALSKPAVPARSPMRPPPAASVENLHA